MNYDKTTEAFRSVIHKAIDESKRLGHVYTGTEHMLLAMMELDYGMARRILKRFGITKDKLEDEIRSLLKVKEAETMSKVEITKELIDKRLLIKLGEASVLLEDKIVEISPSGNYVRINGSANPWRPINEIEVIEVLEE